MFAKRSSWALALLLALSPAAFALGLGDIRLLSPLNAPLDAEIDLTDVAPDEVNTVQAQLASRETFARYGLDWPAYLGGVQLRTVRTADGRQIIKLKSADAVSDPFVTLLVEVNWSHGHLVREFTVLLDPPVYAPGQTSAAAAAVAAPATGAGTREGAIARPAESAAPAAASAPAASAAPAVSAPAAAATPGTAASGTHVVRRGETLSQIAAAAAGANATSPRGRSWMVAIYQANPKAFEQNMNLLHSGAILRLPDAATVAAISPGEATAEIHRQYAAWRAAPGAAPVEGAGTQPGRLKLVTPSQPAAPGAAPGAAGPEVGQLQGRVHDLEAQLAESKRLLEMKNADLARLQAQLAAKQAAEAAAASTAARPATPEPQPQATAPPTSATAPPPSATAPAPPAAEVTPAAPSETQPAPPPAQP
ncbi:MAG: hypothetical protein JO361_08995, partial [Gammaproteobacteria bacterium]|nr:hypothetical protein [Gammaproteobacteria bacterium]